MMTTAARIGRRTTKDEGGREAMRVLSLRLAAVVLSLSVLVPTTLYTAGAQSYPTRAVKPRAIPARAARTT